MNKKLNKFIWLGLFALGIFIAPCFIHKQKLQASEPFAIEKIDVQPKIEKKGKGTVKKVSEQQSAVYKTGLQNNAKVNVQQVDAKVGVDLGYGFYPYHRRHHHHHRHQRYSLFFWYNL